MVTTLKTFFNWLFSLQQLEVTTSTPAERLLFSMKITSKCRYNASIRIRRLSQFSFFTTVILSLGLILIPLLQNASIQLAYPPRVLNMLQIFLAVAVLVYSVINSTAKYETRAEKLNECGDKIKGLIRELRVAMSAGSSAPPNLDELNQRYSDITTDSENHTRADYSLTVIRTPECYHITGIPLLWETFKAHFANLPYYVLPAFLLLTEGIFILDMLGLTCILTHTFHPVVTSGNE